MRAVNGLDNFLMAFPASLLDDSKIVWFDADRVGVVSRREGERMPEAVGGF